MLYFFVALIVVALGYFVAWPLLQTAPAELQAPSPQQLRDERALAERDPIERALAETDFDHSTGKINDAEWQRMRAPLETRLAATDAATEAQEFAVDDSELELEIQIARARQRKTSA